MRSYFSKYSLLSPILAFACMLPCKDSNATGNIEVPAVLPSMNVAIELFSTVTRPDSTTFTVSFSRVGNLILVQGRADTTTGNFILDTGCPHLVLNLTYFRHYNATYDHQA